MICYSLSKLILYGRGTWTPNATGNFYKISASVSIFDQSFLAFSAILGILASIIMFSKKHNGMSQTQFICGSLIVAISGMWTIITVINVGISPLLVGNFPPSVFFVIGVVLIGFDDDLFAHFSRVCGFFSTVFFAVSLFFALQFLMHYGAVGVRFGTSHILYFFQMGIWTLAAFALGTDITKWEKLKIILLITCILLSIIILSRGWIIQTGILFVLYVMKLNRSQAKRFPLKALLLLTCIILVLIFMTRSYLREQWDTLLARVTEDTRTQQIIQFLQQVDVSNLIVGGGYSASYSWLDNDYGAIDNQILLIMFRYGIIITILYMIIFMIPFFGTVRSHKANYLNGINLMWLLSMAGLSIYCTINIDIAQMVVLIVAGHNLKENRNRKEFVS